MHTFNDGLGREWTLTITVAEIKEIKAARDLNVYGLIEDGCKGLGDLLGNPVELVEVLAVLCQGQIRERGLDERAFLAGFFGDGLGRAARAFAREVLDFFPDAPTREAGRVLLDKAEEVKAAAAAEVIKRLQALTPESVLRTPNASSGGVPESSASTPTA